MTTDTLTPQRYHQQTKHQLTRYARGPESLDWDNQPNPFRHYADCTPLPLPLTANAESTPYADLFEAGGVAPRPLDLQHLGLLLELSLGLSAWKVYGPDRWSLRINPSSGNLHPTECYLVVPPLAGVGAGVYHYQVYAHQLERRCDLQPQAAALQPLLGGDRVVIGLSSIHKRESWKYGERAYRYCQHDVGHALAALRYACGLLGWRATLLEECSDLHIAQLLGLDRAADYSGGAERESPDLLLQVTAARAPAARVDVATLAGLARAGHWSGQANRLTRDDFYKWPIVQQVEAACSKPATAAATWSPPPAPPLPAGDPGLLAATLIRQRRSAQGFDAGAPPLAHHHFARLLQALLPRPETPPLDLLPWAPRLHLVLFVHRVEGLAPGLYALARSGEGEALLRQRLRGEFAWQGVAGLPLYLLQPASTLQAARTLACHQPIAADSAFSLAMLAEFDAALAAAPWRYRQLHWEAGVIGQALYLEAEAAGVRGTGIGCYFDDAVHELLGVRDTSLQDLYHFTVGTPRRDDRVQSEPPYGHLQR